MRYYKFLTDENKGEFSHFDYTKYLPKGGKPGKWLPKVGIVELCESGYHAFESRNIPSWINAQLFEVEFKGDVVDGKDKVVGYQMRIVRKIDTWNEKTARKFACYCARDVLPIHEKDYPNDDRLRKAIEVAELYADGKATEEELDAARDAARAAAWDAARDAARAAAWDAARDAARAAAWDAARDAARDAAWAAALDAARDAARDAALDAARDAARAAAWDAARAAAWDAAWDAARAAAWDAARDAARDAAWDAARTKYTARLLEMLDIEEEKNG